ncbi:hypothetical protein RRG08_002238 [Elysia crispata]|uniref:Uncharacterized protein n=1 Tax=Elysia crispata TaxID=231223 RepID=A0AAE0ZB29_9GAST|nr:hypothetical protein RRG08_002238 [Elysia crispata]
MIALSAHTPIYPRGKNRLKQQRPGGIPKIMIGLPRDHLNLPHDKEKKHETKTSPKIIDSGGSGEAENRARDRDPFLSGPYCLSEEIRLSQRKHKAHSKTHVRNLTQVMQILTDNGNYIHRPSRQLSHPHAGPVLFLISVARMYV